MTAKKKTLRAGGLAAAFTIGLVLLGVPAFAGTSPAAPPPAIAAWFAQDAAQVAGDVLESKAVGLEPARSGGEYAAGAPARLHDWNPAFVSGTSDEVALARDEWVATLYRNGQVVGTIAAILTPAGTAAFSYADDDVAAGKALAASRDAGGKLVQDPRMGGLVEVRADGTASGVSKVAASMVQRAQGAAGLRAAIRDAHEPGPLGAEGGSGTDAGAPADDNGGAFGLALALAGLVLWLAWRRKSVAPVREA